MPERAPDQFEISPDAPPFWPETIGESDACVNCGAELSGDFCHACGQKRVDARLNVLAIASDTCARLTNWDRRILLTLSSMVLRPGAMIRDYVSGKRRPYLSPLGFLFLGAAIQLLSFWFVEDALRERMLSAIGESNIAFSDAQNAKAMEIFGTDLMTAVINIYVNSVKQAYTYLALFSFATPFGFALYVCHRLIRDRFTLGETMVFALFCSGQALIVTAIANCVLIPTLPAAQTFSGPLLYLVVTFHCHRGFFRHRFTAWLATFIALGAAVVCFITSILMAFAVSLSASLWFGWSV